MVHIESTVAGNRALWTRRVPVLVQRTAEPSFDVRPTRTRTKNCQGILLQVALVRYGIARKPALPVDKEGWFVRWVY